MRSGVLKKVLRKPWSTLFRLKKPDVLRHANIRLLPYEDTSLELSSCPRTIIQHALFVLLSSLFLPPLY